MRNQRNIKSKIKQSILVHIENNLNNYLIIILFFLIGIVLGVIFLNNSNDQQQGEIKDYVNGFVDELKENYTIEDLIQICKDAEEIQKLEKNVSLDKKAIMDGLYDNTIDVISTDHAPHSNKEKLSPYNEAPNGIIGLETSFSLSYELLGLDKTLEKMAYNPRRILGVNNKKMIEVALDESWVVAPSLSKSKCKVSPYKGMKLKGIIINE